MNILKKDCLCKGDKYDRSLCPCKLDHWAKVWTSYGYYQRQPVAIVSPARYKEIMESPELRRLYGIKDERMDDRV